jgi:hypothetical protein
MSCYYKSLPRLIPRLLVSSRQNTEQIIVSPWIDNIVLYPPMFGVLENQYTQEQIDLGSFLLKLARDYDMRFLIVAREQDYRLERTIRNLISDKPENVRIHLFPYLHAKAVITDSFVLQTSANLIRTSLYRNIETCSLSVNHYSSANEWLRNELSVYC